MKLIHDVHEGDPVAGDFEHIRGSRLRKVVHLSLFGIAIYAGIAVAVVAACR